MDRYTLLKKKLRDREIVAGAAIINLDDPVMLPAFDVEGMDYVQFDMEHGRHNTESLTLPLREMRRIGLPTVVRVQDCLYHLISKTLDRGADGIMVPHVDTVEQAVLAVESVYFPPIGKKGFGGWAELRDGETIEEYQKNRVLLLQLESQQGLDNLGAMIERCGEHIDGFLIGPSDMSIALGTPLELDSAAMRDAERYVASECAKAGKSCGVFSADVEHAKLYLDMGMNIVWNGEDYTYLQRGVRAAFGDILSGR